MTKVFNRTIKLVGDTRVINSVTVKVLEYDSQGKVSRASGLVVPTGAGYAKGCLFVKTDAADGTKAIYENQGTTSVASFNLMGDISAAELADGAITVAKLATDAVETAKIKNANVTLAKLAAGITPSHVVKFAGKFTTAGGDAAEQASVAGVVATDVVVASIQDNGTNNVTLLQSVPATDVINFTMSADPAADCIISYMVLRAAA
jgi:hypothetical protein